MARALFLMLVVPALLAFSSPEERAIIGEWQGREVSIALRVTPEGTGIYIAEGYRTEGAVKVHDVVAQAVTFTVGEKRLVMFFARNGDVRLAEEGSIVAFEIEKARP